MKKKRLWIFAAVAVFVVALPYLTSIPPLKQLFIWRVEQKTGAKVQIDHAQFSWLGPQKMEGIQFTSPQIEGEIDEFVSNVPFWKLDSMGRSIGKINASGTTQIDGQSGKFSVRGSYASASVFQFTFSMTEMPTVAIDRFFNTKELAASAIGPQFNASGSASLDQSSGKLDLDLSSSQASGQIHASLGPDFITLREPLSISLYLTPPLTRAITNGALSIQSVDPARLMIEPNGFRLPRSLSLAEMQIGSGTLDLRRIHIQNGTFLTPLTKFLKARISTKETDAWFTNVDFSLREGLLTLGRVDALLANSLHLCGWGTADLGREQLDMIFGIPADTLSRSLGIQNVSSGYVLQIPVTGTFRSPQFDTGSATAKIAALIAAGQVQKQKGILGGAATLIGRASEEKAPPPKRPFPWER